MESQVHAVHLAVFTCKSYIKSYGSIYQIYFILIFSKMLASTFSAGCAGMKALFMRILLLPLLMGILWCLYYNAMTVIVCMTI